MFDLQTMFDNHMARQRAERMKNSLQLTVVELQLQLGNVLNKDLPVVFDNGAYRPCGINSWRGVYAEPAFTYAAVGAPANTSGCSYDSDEIERQFDFGPTYRQIASILPDRPTVNQLLELLSRIQGKTFQGYKGGDFTMGKTSPLWVANYGEVSGFKQPENDDDPYCQGVVGILEAKDAVAILTELMES